MSQATTELKHVPLTEIRENPNALRPVNRQTEEYEGLVESIRQNGVLNPIVVRECIDPATKAKFYSLIDGLHRFTASKDAGREDIPCHVTSMEDAAVLEAQIIANIQKVDTKPVQYSKALVRILSMNPLLTLAELAGRLSKSQGWLNDRLGLVKVHKDIQPLVDEGKINLSNAYSLAKLPEADQPDFLDRAMTMQPAEFIPTVNQRIKDVREAARQGRQPSSAFQPVQLLRKAGEIKDELMSYSVGKELLAKLDVKTPEEAWKLAVQWIMNIDPVSVQLQVERDKQRKAELEEAKEKRKKERLDKAAKEAAEKAASMGQEAILAEALGVEPVKHEQVAGAANVAAPTPAPTPAE